MQFKLELNKESKWDALTVELETPTDRMTCALPNELEEFINLYCPDYYFCSYGSVQ